MNDPDLAALSEKVRKLEAKVKHMTMVITAFADLDDKEVYDIERWLEEWNDARDNVKACRSPKQGE